MQGGAFCLLERSTAIAVPKPVRRKLAHEGALAMFTLPIKTDVARLVSFPEVFNRSPSFFGGALGTFRQVVLCPLFLVFVRTLLCGFVEKSTRSW